MQPRVHLIWAARRCDIGILNSITELQHRYREEPDTATHRDMLANVVKVVKLQGAEIGRAGVVRVHPKLRGIRDVKRVSCFCGSDRNPSSALKAYIGFRQ